MILIEFSEERVVSNPCLMCESGSGTKVSWIKLSSMWLISVSPCPMPAEMLAESSEPDERISDLLCSERLSTMSVTLRFGRLVPASVTAAPSNAVGCSGDDQAYAKVKKLVLFSFWILSNTTLVSPFALESKAEHVLKVLSNLATRNLTFLFQIKTGHRVSDTAWW